MPVSFKHSCITFSVTSKRILGVVGHKPYSALVNHFPTCCADSYQSFSQKDLVKNGINWPYFHNLK
uniref:Uncharacterized protein n=1 Tax=Anguilla anguilla TaxID=7936 RepID=A0A0E9THA1_ANGAN